MGVFGAIMQAFVPTMLDARHDLASGGVGARERIRDDDARHGGETFAQLPQEPHGRPRIAPRLPQDVEHHAILIDRAPESVLHAVDLHEHRIEMPLIARLRSAAAQRVRL